MIFVNPPLTYFVYVKRCDMTTLIQNLKRWLNEGKPKEEQKHYVSTNTSIYGNAVN